MWALCPPGKNSKEPVNYNTYITSYIDRKYVVKHKSAKLLMMYVVGKLEAALNICHLILSTSSQRVSYLELVC